MFSSSTSTTQLSTPIGPYKATQLWNEIVNNFNENIKLGRHRRHMKTFDDCFVASEAVDWVHQFLTNKNEYSGVTRFQAVQLLRKLQASNIFEDVRGKKHNKELFEDNNKLYRLKITPRNQRRHTVTGISDENGKSLKELSSSKSGRVPLSSRTSLMNLPILSRSQKTSKKEEMKKECELVAMSSTRISKEETDGIWKNMVINKLQRVLGLNKLSDLIQIDSVNPEYIIHNVSHVSKNGVVTNIPKTDQLPHWVLSAMRCLAHWPDKVDKDLPSYEGFERDVLNVVKDYFYNHEEPLLTCQFYEIFAFIQDFLTSSNSTESSHVDDSNASSETFPEVEEKPYRPAERRAKTSMMKKLKAFSSSTSLNSEKHQCAAKSDSLCAEPPTPSRRYGDTGYRRYPVQYASITSIGQMETKSLCLPKDDKMFYSMNDVRENKRFCETLRGNQTNVLYNWTTVENDIRSVVSKAIASPTSHAPYGMSPRYLDNLESKKDWRRRQPSPPPYVPPPPYIKKNSVYVCQEEINNEIASNLKVEDYKTPEKSCKTLSRSISSPCIVTPLKKNKMIEALQTALLLLPPGNRRKLHLLLRLMSKMISNRKLKLVSGESNRDFVISTFTICIIRPEKKKVEDLEIADAHLVSLLLDNYQAVLSIPETLKDQIEERIISLRRAKSLESVVLKNDWADKVYCSQVSVKEFENQKLSSSQQALRDLLDAITKNENMTDKEKKKRLKEFKMSYPEIYARKFKNEDPLDDKTRPTLKQSLLQNPIIKFKGLRN